MRPFVRPLALGALVGGLLLAGCGVEAGTGASEETPTTTTEATSPMQDQAREVLEETYRDLGFSAEESECLAEAIAGSMEGGAVPDMTTGMDAINECDIDAGRLLEFNEQLGAGSLEDGMKTGMEASLRNLGLTDAQATCVADAFIDEFGVSTGSMGDPTVLEGFFEGCGVTLPGGD